VSTKGDPFPAFTPREFGAGDAVVLQDAFVHAVNVAL
jgi:hypothetical protein